MQILTDQERHLLKLIKRNKLASTPPDHSNVLYFEMIAIEKWAVMVSVLRHLSKKENIFGLLPHVLFDVIFQFLMGKPQGTIKPSVVMRALDAVNEEKIPASDTYHFPERAAFFKNIIKFTPDSSSSTFTPKM